MAASDWKSKKGLDASFNSTQPHDLVFFTDKMLGLYVVPEALRAKGFKVECKSNHFPEDTEDSVWLPEVGRRGWIVLTADKRLKHNHIEIVALLKSNTHSFVLTSSSYTGKEVANTFIAAMPQIIGIVKAIPAPAVCAVHKTGDVKVQYTYEHLSKLAGEGGASQQSPR